MVGAVKVLVPPLLSTLASKRLPLSEVRVWLMLSELVTVIFWPGFTLAGT